MKSEEKFTLTRSFMIWGWMSSKGPGEMTIIASSANEQVDKELVNTFLIPAVENMFGDDDVMFQNDIACCHRAKSVKLFFRKGISTQCKQ